MKHLRTLATSLLIGLTAAPAALAAPCTLGSTWSAPEQIIGVPGIHQSMLYAMVNNYSLNRMFIAAYDYSVESIESDFAIYKQDDYGLFVKELSWKPGVGREVYTGTIAVDDSGAVWGMVGHCDLTQMAPPGHDCKLSVLKRTTAGVWSVVNTSNTYNGYVIGPYQHMVARGGGANVELYAHSGNWEPENPADPYNPATYYQAKEHWIVLKYTSNTNTLTTIPVSPYAGLTWENRADPQFVRVAPNGRIWIGGRVEDKNDDVHAVLQESNSTGTAFTVKLDYRFDPIPSTPGNDHDTGDRFRDVTFDDEDNFYLAHTYWTTTDPLNHYRDYFRSQVFKGPVSNPASASVIEADNQYFPPGQTIYWNILWHWLSRELFLGGVAYDLPDSSPPTTLVNFTRRGNGPFVNSSSYTHNYAGGYDQPWYHSMMEIDNVGSVWNAYSAHKPGDAMGKDWVPNAHIMIQKLSCN